MKNQDGNEFMQRAIDLAFTGMNSKRGGPFGAVIVKDHQIIGEGYNSVTSINDPTAHAEIVAIRNACQNIGRFHLEDCDIYCSCEPCPMCLGAIYWARIRHVFFASDRHHASEIGFDDASIYHELCSDPGARKISFIQIMEKEGNKVLNTWNDKPDKIPY